MVSDRTDAVPLWLLIVAVTVSLVRSSMMYSERVNPPRPQQQIVWNQPKDVDSTIFKTRKPAVLFFLHDKKCRKCSEMERSVETPEIAKIMRQNYIPVRVPVPKLRSEQTEEVKALKENYSSWSPPALVVVPPECWGVPMEDSYILPDMNEIGWFRVPDSQTIAKFLERSKTWHPEPPSFGNVRWVRLKTALAEATDEKPAILFFGRSCDYHSDRVRSEIFGNANITRVINEHFLPAFIVNVERKGKENSERTKELIARFRVKSFPSIVVTSPSRPSQMMTGFAGEKETLEFLTHARGK